MLKEDLSNVDGGQLETVPKTSEKATQGEKGQDGKKENHANDTQFLETGEIKYLKI